MITLEQAKAAATKVVEANPNAINPNDGEMCLYNRVEGAETNTPDTAEHCLGGTVLLELGLDLPREGKSIYAAFPDDFSDAEGQAIVYISSLQFQADNQQSGFNVKGPAQRPWGEALQITNERYAR